MAIIMAEEPSHGAALHHNRDLFAFLDKYCRSALAAKTKHRGWPRVVARIHKVAYSKARGVHRGLQNWRENWDQKGHPREI